MATIISDGRITNNKIESNRERIKENIKNFHNYFDSNYKRFNWWRKFVFQSTLSSAEIDINNELGRPNIEFNIMESKLSRILGEFAGHEPNLEVSQADLSMDKVPPQVIRIVEGYIRSIFFNSNRDNLQYDIYRDIISGGFSAFKVLPEYANELSFDYQIMMKRCFDPTLCGWDINAQDSHKGDGNYCYEIFPKTKEEFEREYGAELTDGLKFNASLCDFNWTYTNEANQKIILIADYYEKKKSKAKIVQFLKPDGTTGVSLLKDYQKMVQTWNDITLPPPIIGDPRETEFTKICRYRLIENKVLEYVETDYKYLPIIFVDGNSLMLRDQSAGSASQLTRPMLYNMMGVQKMKNLSGIMIANHIESTPQSQFMVSKESIPEEYKDAWIYPQKANTMVYNAFKNDNPDIPLPPPSPVTRPQIPQEFMATFMGMDQVGQSVMGAYDALLGIQDNEISGEAIKAGATQSNAASKPFMVGYIKALNRAAEIIIDLLPKYMTTPRTLPFVDGSGKSSYSTVNAPGSPSLSYNSNALTVKVEAGVNFELQRQQAFQMLSLLMERVPVIGQFISTEPAGLEMLLDNLEIRGIDALKEAVPQFMQQVKQQQQMAQKMQQVQMQQQMQMAQQNNPIKLKEAELKLQAIKVQADIEKNAAQVAINEKDADTKRMVAMAQVGETMSSIDLERDRLESENARTAVEAAISVAGTHHEHAMDILGLHHEMKKEINKSQQGVLND